MKLFKKITVSIIAVLSLSWACHVANAFTLLNSFWFEGRTTFHVNFAADMPNRSEFNSAFEQAMNHWGASSTFIFDSGGSTQDLDPCVDDGLNSVSFANDICGTSFGEGVLAVTLTSSTGERSTRSIILFNDNEEWSVYSGSRFSANNQRSGFDFRRAAVHELGHALGLDHADDEEAIMHPFISDVETPSQDDINGVAARYDADLDNIGLALDNCPDVSNFAQADFDTDGQGDACDGDADNDGVLNNISVDQAFELNDVSAGGFFFGADAADTSPSTPRSLSQTFKVGVSGYLDIITLPLSCSSGDVDISVRRLKASAWGPSVESNDVMQTINVMPDFSSAGLLSVTLPRFKYDAGEELAIVVEPSGGCFWRAAQSATASYVNGAGFFTFDNGNWFPFRGDFPFQTKVTPSEPDNCPVVSNPDQTDSNNNGIGDACEVGGGDTDGDGIANVSDNCVSVPNLQQQDDNANGIGNSCEGLSFEIEEAPVCAPIPTKKGGILMVCF